MNPKISVFVICVEIIISLLYNLHDSTLNGFSGNLPFHLIFFLADDTLIFVIVNDVNTSARVK